MLRMILNRCCKLAVSSKSSHCCSRHSTQHNTHQQHTTVGVTQKRLRRGWAQACYRCPPKRRPLLHPRVAAVRAAATSTAPLASSWHSVQTAIDQLLRCAKCIPCLPCCSCGALHSASALLLRPCAAHDVLHCTALLPLLTLNRSSSFRRYPGAMSTCATRSRCMGGTCARICRAERDGEGHGTTSKPQHHSQSTLLLSMHVCVSSLGACARAPQGVLPAGDCAPRHMWCCSWHCAAVCTFESSSRLPISAAGSSTWPPPKSATSPWG